MSEAIAFDTHRFVKNLMAKGFTEVQAARAQSSQAPPRESGPRTRRVGGLADHEG